MGFIRSAAAVYCGLLLTLQHGGYAQPTTQPATCSATVTLGPDVRDAETTGLCLAGECSSNRVQVKLYGEKSECCHACVSCKLNTRYLQLRFGRAMYHYSISVQRYPLTLAHCSNLYPNPMPIRCRLIIHRALPWRTLSLIQPAMRREYK